MSRRIETGMAQHPSGPKALYLGKNGDPYEVRLLKYIPAEIVALYLATMRAVPVEPDKPIPCLAYAIVFAANLILVPLYLYFATRDKAKNKGPLVPQIVLATVAFPVWVFAIGPPFSCLGWYRGWEAAVVLPIATLAIGLYRPAPGS